MSTEFFRKFADMITEAERPGTSKKFINEGVDPASVKYGQAIRKYFDKIYGYGDSPDSALDYLDNNAPFWNQLYQKHDGDIDAIINKEPANVLKKAGMELRQVANELKFELSEAETPPNRKSIY